MNLTTEAMIYLGKAMNIMQNFEHLNVSNNKLSDLSVSLFLQIIKFHNKLKSLDLSYNNMRRSYQQETIAKLPKKLRDILNIMDVYPMDVDEAFIIHLEQSLTILHLNLSGTHLSFDQLLYICRRGLRKSKTILSVHLSDLGLNESQQ